MKTNYSATISSGVATTSSVVSTSGVVTSSVIDFGLTNKRIIASIRY